LSIDQAYQSYTRELRTSWARSLREASSFPIHKELFEALVPLWTLIHGFCDEAIAVNPTKELLLSYLSGQGDLANFVKVSSDHRLEREYSRELTESTKAIAFTSYFNELVSDSLLLVNALHLYNYRGCEISIRCMLEDMYRHLYYKDNREYFLQVHELGRSEHDLDISPVSLRKYLKKATYLTKLEELKWKFSFGGTQINGLHSLNDFLYSRTSGAVHGATPMRLNQFASNLDAIHDSGRATRTLEYTQKFVLLSVTFLIAAHLDLFTRLNESTKRIVFGAFSAQQRPEIRKLFGV
jgi:hypothetical protein